MGEDGHLQQGTPTPGLLEPWSWTSQLYNCKK
jgi:hypothetical protein